jgi:hypothetical protein
VHQRPGDANGSEDVALVSVESGGARELYPGFAIFGLTRQSWKP